MDKLSFNKNQEDAINSEGGPLFVIAGPGSGKTTVLTYHIAKLMERSPGAAFRVLAITFTVKAAREMTNRLHDLLKEDWAGARIKIMTFHAFCTEILRMHGNHIGLRPDFTIIDEADKDVILKEILLTTPGFGGSVESTKDFLSAVFKKGVLLSEFSNKVNAAAAGRNKIAAALLEGYLGKLIENNMVDFDSMLYFVNQLFEKNPNVLRRLRIAYKHVCVDEFQDTTAAQYRILRYLCPTRDSNLFVVADDDQLIFQWCGADLSRIKTLIADYNPRVLQLPENFRCPERVVELANQLISHNDRMLENKSPGVSQKDVGNEKVVDYQVYRNFEEEVKGVALRLRAIGRDAWGRCLILARTNNLLKEANAILTQCDIDSVVVEHRQNFKTKEMLFILWALKLASELNSAAAVRRMCLVCNMFEPIGFDESDVVMAARTDNISCAMEFFVLLKRLNRFSQMSEVALELVGGKMKYKDFIDSIIEILIPDSDVNSCGEECHEELLAWREAERSILREQGEVPLYAFIQSMDLSPKVVPIPRDCVRLHTVHTAKGMEAEHVFVIGLVEDIFPAYRAIRAGGQAVQEERRSCFVALTRTSGRLYLSRALQYGRWSRQESRFIAEMNLHAMAEHE